MEELKIFEPDWKRYFYSLALRLISAQGYLALGKFDDARVSIDEAVEIVAAIDNAPQYQSTPVIRVAG